MEFSCSGDSGQNPIGDDVPGTWKVDHHFSGKKGHYLDKGRRLFYLLRHGPPACWPAQAGTIFDLGELGSEKKKS